MAFNQQRLVLRSSQTASNSASIAFTSVIDANFSVYMLKVRDLVAATDKANLLLTFSTDNGSTYLNSNYFYTGLYSDSGGGTGNTGFSNAASTIQIQSFVSNVSSRGASGDYLFYDLNSNVLGAKMKGQSCWYDPDALVLQAEWGGQNSGTTAVTAIKLAMSSGNITSGNFYFYGVNET